MYNVYHKTVCLESLETPKRDHTIDNKQRLELTFTDPTEKYTFL